MAKDYDQLAVDVQADPITIAQVDCQAHQDFCKEQGINGYPTLKFFPLGGGAAEELSIGRDLASLKQFVAGKVAAQATGGAAAPSTVLELTDATFKTIVSDANMGVLVAFYAPWCGHCKKLEPTYAALGDAFASEPTVIIAKVDGSLYKDVSRENNVGGFPTIKWFGRGSDKAPVNYEGGRSLAELVAFVNRRAGTARSADGALSEDTGVIAEFDRLIRDIVSGSPAQRAAAIDAASARARGAQAEPASVEAM